jgi:hypothetical protein
VTSERAGIDAANEPPLTLVAGGERDQAGPGYGH